MAAYISFQPTDFFNTKLYTGNSSSTHAITGVGFAPDMVWTKNMDYDASHRLHDVLQDGPAYSLVPDYDYTSTTSYPFSSFDSDGYTINTTNNSLNDSSYEYVSWNWIAGTTSGIAGSPSITPTSYSFNATSGFSMIRYTGNLTAGATLPHGLGTSDIGMIIVKRIDGTANWQVYSEGLGPTKYWELDLATAASPSTTRWNDTAPTSTLFSLGSHTDVNGSGDVYIAYVFAQKRGYSKMGSYIGNNNVDGTFVYTGFRPAYILIKNSSTTDTAVVMDNKRDGYNLENKLLQPTNADVEQAGSNGVDILSNGFKCRKNDGWTNGSGNTMVYAAFAEFPLVSSNSKAGTAR